MTDETPPLHDALDALIQLEPHTVRDYIREIWRDVRELRAEQAADRERFRQLIGMTTSGNPEPNTFLGIINRMRALEEGQRMAQQRADIAESERRVLQQERRTVFSARQTAMIAAVTGGSMTGALRMVEWLVTRQ